MKKPRSDKGRTVISPRDLKVLNWVAEQYTATLDQVRLLLGRDPGKGSRAEGNLSESAARQVIARWRRLGYAEQQKLLTNSPPWIWLTREGLQQLGVSYQFYVPRLGALAHLHAINVVRLYLELQRSESNWKSERTLRTQQQFHVQGTIAPHLPDAELWTPRGTFAIEVEMTMKEHARLLNIIQELASNYSAVLYFVTAAAYTGVELAKGRLPQDLQAKVQLYRLEKIIGYNQIAS